MRMARNEGISYLRRQHTLRKALDHVPKRLSEELTNNMIQSRELERTFQLALQQLSPQRRTIYVLGKLEGWERTKIAHVLGISEATVKELMRRAIKEVRERITEKLNR